MTVFAGADILYSSIVWEEQSYTGCSGPGWALHSEIVAPYVNKSVQRCTSASFPQAKGHSSHLMPCFVLVRYGTDEQKQRWLPGMTSGELIGAIAMTEPGAGSDLQGVRTVAKQDGDDWILNGSKTYITNGYNCDLCIVVAKTDTEAKGAHGISLFMVEKGMAGFNKGQKLKKMGMHAQGGAQTVTASLLVWSVSQM